MKKLQSSRWIPGYILLISGLMFIPGLGLVHLFDWDEINFAEMARELILTNQYSHLLIDFEPFYQKPPLFIWMQVFAMKTFGINEFAARLPNALCGISIALILFLVGRKTHSARFGLLWSLFYSLSILPHFYNKSGIIDPWFNTFMFLAVFQLYRYHVNDQLKSAAWGGVFLGLSVLTKGPVALLIVGVVGLIILLSSSLKKIKPLRIKGIIIFSLTTLAVASSWFLYDWIVHGPEFVLEFIRYQLRLLNTEDAGHGGPIFYHLVILLLGCFPMSVLALGWWTSNRKAAQSEHFQILGFWMHGLFWTVLIIFSLVQTKIVHYSSMCYFPLSFFAAAYVDKIMALESKVPTWIRWTLFTIGGIWSMITLFLPILGNHLEWIKPYVEDPFAVANMAAQVDWPYRLCLIGLILPIAMILWSRVKRIEIRWLSLFVGMGIFIQSFIYFFTPRIEAYSQRAAIEFFKGLEAQNAVVQVLGYKSYAHLYYSGKIPSISKDPSNTYAICKVTDRKLEQYKKEYEFWYEKNGFVFFRPK